MRQFVVKIQFTQDSIKTVGTTWMRYIESGYFD